MRPRYALLVLSAAAGLVLAGCTSSADQYEESLKKAGFDNVKVSEDKETKTVYNKKKKKNEKKTEIAYDFDWTVNTDSDPSTCVVELESETGTSWYIDEIDGNDVSDSPSSPKPDGVRDYLKSHDIDC